MTFPTGDRISGMGPHRLLGMLPRTQPVSPHEGSKKHHKHVTDVAQDRPSRIARAQAWSQSAGRPVPPHLRWRSPVSPAGPMASLARLVGYQASYRVSDRTARLTPAQVRRLRHKHGRPEAKILLGFDPAEREAQRVLAEPGDWASFIEVEGWKPK